MNGETHDTAEATGRRRARRSGPRAAVRAFTLLELLMVMALISVLASITLVVGRGVTERSKVAQARAEMAVLAAALEQYKQQYGDYPWTPEAPPAPLPEDGRILFNALCGYVGPKANAVLASRGRTFVDLSRFALESQAPLDLPDATSPGPLDNAFLDPWGTSYGYHYRKVAPVDLATDVWKSRGYLLYSLGADGVGDVSGARESGLLDDLPSESDAPENRDNLYHGRD